METKILDGANMDMKQDSIRTYLNKIEIFNRDEVIKLYGETVFDVFYRGDYNIFVKNYFTELYQGHIIDASRILMYIQNMYAYSGKYIKFSVIADGITISESSSENDIDSIAGLRQKDSVLLTFDCDPQFNKLQETITDRLKGNKLLLENHCPDVPTLFTILLKRINGDQFIVEESIFI